jgi:hypothetical protein
VTGTIAADVVAIAGQNVSPGDFDAFEDAITSNTRAGTSTPPNSRPARSAARFVAATGTTIADR